MSRRTTSTSGRATEQQSVFPASQPTYARRGRGQQSESKSDVFAFQSQAAPSRNQTSRKRGRQQQQEEEEEEEEEEEQHEGQSSQSRRQMNGNHVVEGKAAKPADPSARFHISPAAHTGFYDLTQDECDAIVAAVQRHILFRHAQKLPVKMSNINKEVELIKKVKGHAARAVIMRAVKSAFRYGPYGYDLFEVDERERDNTVIAAKKQKSKSVTTSKTYILRNPSTDPDEIRILNDMSTNNDLLSHRGFLMIILSIIYIKDGCSEDDLRKYLQSTCGIDLTSTSIHISRDLQLGDVSHVLSILCQQLYLEKRKSDQINEQGTSPWIYQWGQRAHAETSPEQVYRFICEYIMQCPIDPIMIQEIQKKAKLKQDIKAKTGVRPSSDIAMSQSFSQSQ